MENHDQIGSFLCRASGGKLFRSSMSLRLNRMIAGQNNSVCSHMSPAVASGIIARESRYERLSTSCSLSAASPSISHLRFM